MPLYKVSGIFTVNIEANTFQDARQQAIYVLSECGVRAIPMSADEVKRKESKE